MSKRSRSSDSTWGNFLSVFEQDVIFSRVSSPFVPFHQGTNRQKERHSWGRESNGSLWAAPYGTSMMSIVRKNKLGLLYCNVMCKASSSLLKGEQNTAGRRKNTVVVGSLCSVVYRR